MERIELFIAITEKQIMDKLRRLWRRNVNITELVCKAILDYPDCIEEELQTTA